MAQDRTLRLSRYAVPVLVVYVLLLGLALLWPTSSVQARLVFDVVNVLRDLSVPRWLADFTRMEMVMNALIIAPVSLLVVLIFPRVRWQDCLAYTFLAASCVELVQGLFLPHRHASFSDIVSNTCGGLLGAVVAIALRRLVRALATRPVR